MRTTNTNKQIIELTLIWVWLFVCETYEEKEGKVVVWQLRQVRQWSPNLRLSLFHGFCGFEEFNAHKHVCKRYSTLQLFV